MLFLSFFRRGRTFFFGQIKEKESVRGSFAAVLDGETNPDRVGRSVAVNAAPTVSGTRQRQAAKPGAPTGLGIGSCDVMGFGCLGRAIGATYNASAARHSNFRLKQVVLLRKYKRSRSKPKKKSSLL